MKKTNRIDFWTGICLAVLGVFVWILTADMPETDLGINPGSYPRFIGILLVILGFFQALSNFKGGYPEKGEAVDWKKFSLTAILFVGTFVYVKLLKLVGFPVLTPFFMFGIMKLFGYENNLKGAIISLVFSEGIFLLFYKVFMIFLPLGFIG